MSKYTIYPRERFITVLARDGFTVGCAFAMVIPGWFMNSWALQTIGFIVFWVIMIGAALQMSSARKLTADEAHAQIDKWEAGE